MLKTILKLLLILLLPIALYLIAMLLLSIIPVNKKQKSCPSKNTTIYLSTNGVHVDLILDRDDLPQDLLTALRPDGQDQYLAFGWGDKGFYLDTPTWAELKVSTALRAAFINSPTAMHVTRYRERKNDWYTLSLCPDQLSAMIAHIHSGFKLDENGQIMEIPDVGYTPADRFYEANGNYHCIRTCNVWANEGLKKAGVRTAVWAPFDWGILYHRTK